jgi:hypothetical protein
MAFLDTYGGLLFELGYDGQIATLNPHVTDSKINESATAIQFGRAVARGAEDNTAKVPAADSDQIIGIAARQLVGVADQNGVTAYAQGVAVPVLKLGFVFATAAEATTRGDGVISITAGGGTLGSVTGGAAGTGRVAIPGATWETSTAAGEIGVVRIVQ